MFFPESQLVHARLSEDHLSERMLGVRADLKTLEKLVAEEMPEAWIEDGLKMDEIRSHPLHMFFPFLNSFFK